MLAVKGFNEISYDDLMDLNGGDLGNILGIAAISLTASGHPYAGAAVGIAREFYEMAKDYEPKQMQPSTCPYPYYSPGPYWWSSSCH